MKAIRLENIGKRFILSHENDILGKGFFHIFSGQKMSTDFWALKNINMEVESGKVIGIIGRNGAGKSTLLNILSGIAIPTTGEVKINGRVSSLLTLGAGFHDELTGEENIYLNSSILGINRNEINKKYRSIVEFSELDGFLDAPLQTYSMGMRLRLGFSIAIHMDFDILLIDEVLSVGDISFQKKCFDKIDEFKKQGKTMIITTQALDVIDRLCEEAFLLENGEIAQKGHPQKVIAHYMQLLDEKKLSEAFRQRYRELKWWADKSFWGKKEGSKEARIIDVRAYNADGRESGRFRQGEKMIIKAGFVVDEEVTEPHFGVALFREDGLYCHGPNTLFDGHRIGKLNKGEGSFALEYKSMGLKPGKYRFSVAIWDKNELWAYDYHVGFYKFEVIGENNDLQLLNLEYRWEPDCQQAELKAPQPVIEDYFSGLNIPGQNEVTLCGTRLSLLEILGASDNPKTIFQTGEDLKVKLQFKFPAQPKNYYLWLGLFRIDDAYFHGVWRRIKEEVILVYPGLPLLTGDYYFSIGLLEHGKNRFSLYRHKAAVFKVSFLGEDHGAVCLEHSWKWRLPES